MRVPIMIRMYKGKLEIYGDGENFEIDIKYNNEPMKIRYNNDINDKFKPIIVIENGAIINFGNLIYPYIFHESKDDRWEVYNISKNKILKNKRKYLLATNDESAKKGLFHNVQKEI